VTDRKQRVAAARSRRAARRRAWRLEGTKRARPQASGGRGRRREGAPVRRITSEEARVVSDASLARMTCGRP